MFKDYHPEKLSDEQLLEDFQLLVEEYSKAKAGHSEEFETDKDVVDIAIIVVDIILQHGVITFDISGMTEDAKELLGKCLSELIKDELYIPAPYSEALWIGRNKRIDSAEDKFMILVSDKIMFGFVRFIEREDGLHVREMLPFDNPVFHSQDQPSCMPLDFDLKKLPDDKIKELHAEAHDEARIYSIKTGERPPKHTVLKHSFVFRELKHRGLGHDALVELDRLSDEYGSLKDYIFLNDFFKNINAGVCVLDPLISLQGKECRTGLTKKIKLNINWPEWDKKMIVRIKDVILNVIPEEMRDHVEFIIDNNGDEEQDFVPFARMKIEIIPESERQMIKKKLGSFRLERINGK